MGSFDELSLEQVLEQVGMPGWVALSFRCGWQRWPPSMSEDLYKILLDRKLVDPPDAPNAYGAPTADGRALAQRFHALRPQLVTHFEAAGDQMAVNLLQDSLFLPHPQDPEAKDPIDAIAEDIGLDRENVDDPDQWAKSMRELVQNPDALRHVTKEMGHMMAFLKKAMEAIEKLPKDLDRHYRGELTAIGKDLVHDLKLGKLSEEEVHKVLMVFLQKGGDDDGDPEPAPPQSPNTGEKVLA